MKRIILIVLILNILCFNCYAVDFAIFDLRNKIFGESKDIKSLISNSENPMLISSIWDTCTLVISEIDAYFSMLAIFNSIEKVKQTREATDYLIDWLRGIKKTNELSIKNIRNIETVNLAAVEKMHIERIRNFLIQLQTVIDDEIAKVNLIKSSLRR